MRYLVMVSCLLVAGCSRDMHSPIWEQAVKQCEAHGGVVGADWTRLLRDRVLVEAYCADETMVRGIVGEGWRGR